MALGLKGVKVAAFDTRVTEEEIDSAVFILRILVNIFGYAAKLDIKELSWV
jgi:hypothetical protein